MRAAWLPFAMPLRPRHMSFLSGVVVVRDALPLASVFVGPSSLLYPPFSEGPCALGGGRARGAAGRAVGGVRPSAHTRSNRLQRLYTIGSSRSRRAAECIVTCTGGIADMPRGGEREGFLQSGAVGDGTCVEDRREWEGRGVGDGADPAVEYTGQV
ncbi:hypothetical protein B0H14DRAFT_2959834 [Mycena olivaceomarginata]|nr:hypothetical protein B0H14DRAFT_2959834 [Mycena olivaceomarginata]